VTSDLTAGNSELTDAMAAISAKGADVRSMVESQPAPVAALYPFLSASASMQNASRNISEVESRLPGASPNGGDGNIFSLDRVDTSPVRALKPLLKPLPALKQNSVVDSATFPVSAESMMEESSLADDSSVAPDAAGGFIDLFTPFDPVGMDPRIQRFLAKLQDQKPTSAGDSRMSSLATLSVAVLAGVVGVQLVRNKKLPVGVRSVWTRSRYWPALETV
jgi:hypothetical protein